MLLLPRWLPSAVGSPAMVTVEDGWRKDCVVCVLCVYCMYVSNKIPVGARERDTEYCL